MNEELREIDPALADDAFLYGGPADGHYILQNRNWREIIHQSHAYLYCPWMTARLRKPTFISEHLHLQFF